MPKQEKKSGRHAWSTAQIQKMLEFVPNRRTKALIHFLVSTGVRIGAISDMTIEDVAQTANGCKSVRVYADDKEEYSRF